jgi:DNA repair exonuclease SbcCD nuclease subunit
MKPYGLLSDTHNHNFSAFAQVLPTGVNSRLQFTLNEFGRCAAAVYKACEAMNGGSGRIIHAGDLFHVRGSVAPSVFNPTRKELQDHSDNLGTEWVIDAGNHDLEGKHSDRLGNAVAMMEAEHINVVSEVSVLAEHGEQPVVIVPWHERIDDLKRTLENFKGGMIEASDLIIHAPVDGVIMGLPDHGLTPAYLDSLPYKRWFAGHYHNHKQMSEKGWSIGALTHQTWSDVGSKAGFMIVHPDRVEFHETTAPKFVEIGAETDPKSIPTLAKGNFIRIKVKAGTKPAQILELREAFEKKYGALGVRIDVMKEPGKVREGGSTVKAGSSLEVSITDYIKAKGMHERVSKDALAVLAEAA